TKARSIIEYGAEFYLQYDSTKELQKWQNKFMKLAAPGKSSIPIDLRENLQNCESIYERVDKLLGRTWLRCIFSDISHPFVQLQQNYLNYIQNYNTPTYSFGNPNEYQALNNYLHNNTNKNMSIETNTITNPQSIKPKRKRKSRSKRNKNNKNSHIISNKSLMIQCAKETNHIFIPSNKLTYTPKSILYRSHQLISQLQQDNLLNIVDNPTRMPITATPIYKIMALHNNFTVKTDEQLPSNYLFHECYYSDGSSCPNPGIGAYGWYGPYPSSLDFVPHHILPIDHMTTAAICELKATNLFLTDLLSQNIIPKNNQIILFIDNIGVLKYLNFTSYPKYEVYKKEVENMFISLSKLAQSLPDLHINFFKIKSHTGIYGNEKIDDLVHTLAANTATTRNNQQLPMQIYDYPTALSQVYKQIKIKHQQKWINRKNKSTLIYKNNNNWNYKLTKLFGKLSRNDASIMIKVLSEHIEINQYYHDKNYTLKSVIRDKEIMDHHNAMGANQQTKSEIIQHINTKINKINNEIYIIKNKNNKNIPALIPPLIKNNIINPNSNNSWNKNISNINANDPDFDTLYNNHEFNIPFDINNYNLENININEYQHCLCTNCNGNHIENLSHFICHCK
ncbi:MAG: hypothetical protein GY755_01815, partial [Chloroflexi bacterium]|nr:hypothetical protein [Chloroflexota bacterium]